MKYDKFHLMEFCQFWCLFCPAGLHWNFLYFAVRWEPAWATFLLWANLYHSGSSSWHTCSAGYEFLLLQDLNMPTVLGCDVSVVMAVERKGSIISTLWKVRLITECYKLPKSIQNILFQTTQKHASSISKICFHVGS